MLQSIGSTVQGWKLDLKEAYMQLAMHEAQTWRQFIYWEWLEDDQMCGGFFRDLRMQWGAKQSGATFHRGVTSLIVRWFNHVLLTDWVSTIRCPTVRDWIADRRRAGLSGVQLLPALINGFLDDFSYSCAEQHKTLQALTASSCGLLVLGI